MVARKLELRVWENVKIGNQYDFKWLQHLNVWRVEMDVDLLT